VFYQLAKQTSRAELNDVVKEFLKNSELAREPL
jgi:hypothetical protein